MQDEVPGSSEEGSALTGIAIVGMAGRFPGATSIAAYWRNQLRGVDTVSRFTKEELEDSFSDDIRSSPDFVPARSILEDVDLFDAEFFGMFSREAELTDPQQRVFLELAWAAFENAGYDPARVNGPIGVFAGSSYNSYFIRNVCPDRSSVEEFTSNFQVGSYQKLLGALHDFLPSRVAYKLDLRGPAVAIQGACATSLIAVAEACKSLLFYECDMALAGGVSVTFPQKRGYQSLDGGMVSSDGRVRPFDAGANGTVFGSGAGVVVLKRVEDAIADRDHIYAVIRGFGLNNDGAGKVGFTAPSVDGQAAVIAAAQAMAGLEARAVGYVECHGTATPLGDPIEFSALTKAFRATTSDKGFCTLGSGKANVGHLDAAAGVTGLIRATLALHHEAIPPLANFTKPNPNIDLASSPFAITPELKPWPRGAVPRRAGVSAFGVGGANAHIVLEESPARDAASKSADEDRSVHILPVSARTPAALAAMADALADHLETDQSAALADVAFTLQEGRRAFDCRTAIAASSREEAVTRLRNARPATASRERKPSLVFMFPGQGAQYPGMGQALYDSEPVFRRHVDGAAEILEPLIGDDIRKLLYGEIPTSEEGFHPIRSTVLAQPALFVIEHATAQLLLSRGIEPAAMIGHSLGEFVAAHLAGVMSLEDALRLVAMRGRLMQEQPGGAMLGVRLPVDKLVPLLGPGTEIASINAPALCVASGPFDAIAALEARLAKDNVLHRRLHTSHAFHSAMMDPVVRALREETGKIALRAPRRPYVSTVTGQWIRDEEATSPDYWARHCRETVRFADALASLLGDGEKALVEIGPGRTLATFATQAADKSKLRVVATTLPEAANLGEDCLTFAECLADLWAAGVAFDWANGRGADVRRVPLPAYAFERKRYWIDPPAATAAAHALPIEAMNASAPTAAPAAAPEPAQQKDMNSEPAMSTHTSTVQGGIVALLEELSGEKFADCDPATTFLELGFDSLFLGQLAQRLQKTYAIKLTFRQLLREFPSIATLADHVAATLPPEKIAAPAPKPQAAPVAPSVPAAAPAATQPIAIAAPALTPAQAIPAAAAPGVEGLLRAQLETMQQIFAQQLQALGGGAVAIASAQPAPTAPVALVAAPVEGGGGVASSQQAPKPAAAAVIPDAGDAPSRFRMYRPGAGATAQGLTPSQQTFVSDLVARYNAKTPGSKTRTQEARSVLADPRSASGFRAEWKEMVYPLVCPRAKGSKLWDVDGNEYVDLVNGFGQTALGHSPDYVVEAVEAQLKDGFPIGPQTPLAAEVAALFAEMTGNERVTFCNTGSEAVMAAMRVARAVTGREKVVVFSGGYHGQFDEVLVKGARGSGAPGALPIAPGIPNASVSNMIVLPYGKPESIAWLRENCGDCAAVIVETVQSRHPGLQPRDVWAELREITAAHDTVYVFDEVVTGFRVHPGGMQALCGIRADLATYGKVLGGGMPIGVLAGKRQFMDALDGGHWQFGDDSVPEVAPTFFAGTFVRHPLVLAAARAVLRHLKAEGPALQEGLTARTADLAATLNAELARRGIKTRAETFSSWLYLDFSAEDSLASLFFPHMRLLGVHVLEGFPQFLTTAHSEADIAHIVSVFAQTLDALRGAGILVGDKANVEPSVAAPAASAPAAGADAELPESVPLTEPQKEVYLSAQLGHEASCAFNESLSVRLGGPLSKDALVAALNQVIARHDALRGSFGKTGEMMQVARELVLEVPTVDLAMEADPQAAFAAHLADDAETPFDVENGPLVRASVVRLAPESHVLVFTAHHIVCDGWSANVIVSELAALYNAAVTGKNAELPAPLPFRTYALDSAAKGHAQDTEAFWLAEYEDQPPSLELPTDRPRSAVKSSLGATLVEHIDAELMTRVRKAGARQGSTLFATLFTAMQTLIGRLAGEQDVVLTVPTAGQSLVEAEALVGHCVNFLPVRAAFDWTTPFARHLKAVNQKLLAVYDHQDYTLGTLVRAAGIKRELNRTPLTDVQFNLEKVGEKAAFAGLASEIRANPKAFVNFDLFFNFVEHSDGIRVEVDYATDLYDAGTIRRWIAHLRTLLADIVADPDRPIGKLSLLSDAERDWLVRGLNRAQMDYPRDRRIHELFEEQAQSTPNDVAVTAEGTSITYRELSERSTHLARYLASLGGAPHQKVAVAMPRTIDLPVALLAVLKAGHAYVPLDPDHPAARLTQMMEAADASVLVCAGDEIAATAPADVSIVRLDQELQSAIPVVDPHPAGAYGDPARHPAYVIFTSGSTGAPKGIEVAHGAVVNFLASMAMKPGFESRDTLVAVTTVSFDIAALELFLPLVAGGRVVIASRDDVRDGFALVRLIDASGATVVQATPSLWRMLLEAGFQPRPGLKMLCGGEPLPRDLADALLAGGGELWNMYGPTETTIWSAVGRVPAGDAPIGIGEPVANTVLHVLDAGDELAPVGVIGELNIGGDGLARGYYKRDDLTTAAFRSVSVARGEPTQRLYRTGDRARRLASGAIELLGRADHQIKLRGFRIEIGEIESALRAVPGVATAAVTLRRIAEGDSRLAGYYVVQAGSSVEPDALVKKLSATLPAYMVPTLWRRLDALPLTPNGKLDRKSLAAIEPADELAPEVAPEAPANVIELLSPLQRKLAKIWSEVLQIETVANDIPLFSLGADSLHLFRIAARMNQQGIELTARHLMTNPTIADLAEMAGEAGGSGGPAPNVPSLRDFRGGARRRGR